MDVLPPLNAGPGQSQQNIGDVTVGIGGSTTTGAATGKVSNAIALLAKAWCGKNATIRQAGVGKQMTDRFVKLVAISLVYRTMVIPCALLLAVFAAFVVLAVTDHATNIITGLAVSVQANDAWQ